MREEEEWIVMDRAVVTRDATRVEVDGLTDGAADHKIILTSPLDVGDVEDPEGTGEDILFLSLFLDRIMSPKPPILYRVFAHVYQPCHAVTLISAFSSPTLSPGKDSPSAPPKYSGWNEPVEGALERSLTDSANSPLSSSSTYTAK